MWPDQVSNPGPLTYESGALPIALCGPALINTLCIKKKNLRSEKKINLSLVLKDPFFILQSAANPH